MKNIHVLQENIYITSNEEIKDGDWFLTDDKRVEKCAPDWRAREYHKKIIITTDQDLIKDGVQAIDDDFLEWFVKNPSCESFEVEESTLLNTSRTYLGVDKYKIIIPKEETKQETLEEAFNKIVDSSDYVLFDYASFEEGAKWQAERSYSEEDMIKFMQFIVSEEELENTSGVSIDTAKYFLNKFKNK